MRTSYMLPRSSPQRLRDIVPMGVSNPSRVSVGATRRMAASGQLGDGAGYGDQRLRRHSGDVGAAQPPFQHRPFPARAQTVSGRC